MLWGCRLLVVVGAGGMDTDDRPPISHNGDESPLTASGTPQRRAKVDCCYSRQQPRPTSGFRTSCSWVGSSGPLSFGAGSGPPPDDREIGLHLPDSGIAGSPVVGARHRESRTDSTDADFRSYASPEGSPADSGGNLSAACRGCQAMAEGSRTAQFSEDFPLILRIARDIRLTA